ncbi:DUF6931 family protein [Pseudochelatococcus contaminans]|uniref:Uncharacterized protein n=1 Tax=Pseudochelatococcus contaminans TaxID=1538103 RepID=A0A7W6EEB9_9HYPH|nr:hypothetical protein [Pseudochelatococcus contaminans]MBB3808159.1 hypothetical protein [Pseudochelatococcus contaminans]
MVDVGFLPKFRFSLAEQLCTLIEPEEEAGALLLPGQSAVDFVKALVADGQNIDAIRYIAVALPRREAVWWTCATRRCLLPEDLPPAEAEAWAIAETWVYEPTEANRRAAFAYAEALNFGTAGAYAALAVFWSGGSLAPPETGELVPPGDQLTGSAAAASVIYCCVPGEAKMIGKRHEAALAIGIDIANGGNGLPPT